MAFDDLEEFLDKKRYKEGLNRTDKLVKKANVDPIVHVYRARFQEGLGQSTKALEIVASLAERKPAITDTVILDEIDDYLIEKALEIDYNALTAGPQSLALWKNAAVATKDTFMPILCKDRFEFALQQGRLEDANHAFTQWKKYSPDRKVLKYAQAVIYHLISQKTGDKVKKGMFSQLAIRTAEQLVASVANDSELEVVVNVLLQQNMPDKIHDITEANTDFMRRFTENDTALIAYMEKLAEAGKWDYVKELCNSILEPTKKGDNLITSSNLKIWKLWARAHASVEEPDFKAQLNRIAALPYIRGLAVLWYLSINGFEESCVGVLSMSFRGAGHTATFIPEVRDIVAALSKEWSKEFRKRIAYITREFCDQPGLKDKPALRDCLYYETNNLRIEYLAGWDETEALSHFLNYAKLSWSLVNFVFGANKDFDMSWALSIITALFRAHEADRSGRWLLAAFCVARVIPGPEIYPMQVLLAYISQELGLPSMSQSYFLDLSVKEVQLDTASHIGQTRISIQDPGLALDRTTHQKDPYELLGATLKMYGPTIERIGEQACTCVDMERPDLMIELDDAGDQLKNSIQRRLLLLEQRRVERLTNRPQDTRFNFKARTISSWTENLADNRDYDTCENFENVPSSVNLERRLCSAGKVPNGAWIHLQLFIDEVCATISNSTSLLSKVESISLLTQLSTNDLPDLNSGCTLSEIQLIPAWTALASAVVRIFRPAEEPSSSTEKEKSKTVPQMLDDLKAQIDELITPDLPSPTSNGTSTTISALKSSIPNAAYLQHSYLSLDLLKILLRFCTACTDVTKKRRPGTPVDTKLLRPIQELARKKYQDIRAFAVQKQKSINADDLAATMEETWGWIATAREGGKIGDLNQEETGEWEMGEKWKAECAEVARAGKRAWDGVLGVKLEG
ncbi:Hypothetical protein D9617_5g067760 [Elsinoe fawcettii]|nr:Hypothetical protein D9617_5g067760 [Elsinoe fawcettii]